MDNESDGWEEIGCALHNIGSSASRRMLQVAVTARGRKEQGYEWTGRA